MTGAETTPGKPSDPGIFSLVMATYGRTAELDPFLRSLLAQTDRHFELIVVDQNGDERVAPLLLPLIEAGFAVLHLRIARANASVARNLGLAQARGRYVAFPDDDCWYEPDVIAQVRLALTSNTQADGVVGRWVEATPEAAHVPRNLALDEWRRFRGGDASCITVFVHAGQLRVLGGFDERIGPGTWFASSEDTDLILTLLTAGLTLRAAPDIRIHHLHAGSQSLSRALCARYRLYGRGTGALYVKHRLGLWVVARGLAGPWINAFRSPRPDSALVLAALTCFGRIEGMIRWGLGRR